MISFMYGKIFKKNLVLFFMNFDWCIGFNICLGNVIVLVLN